MSELNQRSPRECCKRLCSDRIGTERCRALRGEFIAMCRDEIKKSLQEMCTVVNGKDRILIDNVLTCQAFLVKTLDVSTTLLSNVLGRPSANASRLAGRNGGTDGSFTMKSAIISFFHILANETCDEVPHKPERHLPHGRKTTVFQLYQ